MRLNKFEKIKWVLVKMSQGVKIPAIKKDMHIIPNKEPILLSRNCFLSSLKKPGIAKLNGKKEKLKINAVIVNIEKDMILESPERAIIRPKSLKKFPQKT